MAFHKRSKKEALQHILKEYLAGRLGASNTLSMCLYRQTISKKKYRYCAVGCLFNEAQLADIMKRGLNSEPIDIVSFEIGKDNIEYVTGMTIDELANLQLEHDTACQCFVMHGGSFLSVKEGGKNDAFYQYLKTQLEQIA